MNGRSGSENRVLRFERPCLCQSCYQLAETTKYAYLRSKGDTRTMHVFQPTCTLWATKVCKSALRCDQQVTWRLRLTQSPIRPQVSWLMCQLLSGIGQSREADHRGINSAMIAVPATCIIVGQTWVYGPKGTSAVGPPQHACTLHG